MSIAVAMCPVKELIPLPMSPLPKAPVNSKLHPRPDKIIHHPENLICIWLIQQSTIMSSMFTPISKKYLHF